MLKHKKITLFLFYVLILSVAGLLTLCLLLVRENTHVARLEYLMETKSRSFVSALSQKKEPATIDKVIFIQRWMTFDYVNHLFALPPEYTQIQLGITDTRYPRLTLSEYASDAKLSQTEFLNNVQDAVRTYLTTHQ